MNPEITYALYGSDKFPGQLARDSIGNYICYEADRAAHTLSIMWGTDKPFNTCLTAFLRSFDSGTTPLIAAGATNASVTFGPPLTTYDIPVSCKAECSDQITFVDGPTAAVLPLTLAVEDTLHLACLAFENVTFGWRTPRRPFEDRDLELAECTLYFSLHGFRQSRPSVETMVAATVDGTFARHVIFPITDISQAVDFRLPDVLEISETHN